MLAVLCVKSDTVRRHTVAASYINTSAFSQLAALGQCLIEVGCGVAALQPVGQHGTQAVVGHLNFVHQRIAARCRCAVGRGGGVERQARGRGIAAIGAQKAAHHVQTPHLQRTHALAQGRFHGVFPARLHGHARPQPLQAIQPVALQPGLQFFIDFELLLQRLERLLARSYIGVMALRFVERLLCAAPRVFQRRQAVLQLLQGGFGHLRLGGGILILLFQLCQSGGIGRGQLAAFGAQALQTALALAHLFLQAALLGGQDVDLLLHLHHLLALAVGLLLGAAQCVFQIGQALGLFFDLGGQQLGLLLHIHAAGGQFFQLNSGIFLALLPLLHLLLQLQQALGHALAPFDDVADFRFKARHLGSGLIQPPL